MRVLINNGSNWETFSVLLKPGQVGLSRSKKSHISQDAMRSDSCWFGSLAKVAVKKEPFKLLLDFFGRTFHLSLKQKSCFVMIVKRLSSKRCV